MGSPLAAVGCMHSTIWLKHDSVSWKSLDLALSFIKEYTGSKSSTKSLASSCQGPVEARIFSARFSCTPICTLANRSSSCSAERSLYSNETSSFWRNCLCCCSEIVRRRLPTVSQNHLCALASMQTYPLVPYHFSPRWSLHGIRPLTKARMDDKRCFPST